MTLEALASVIAHVRKVWGEYGYSITEVRPTFLGGGYVAVSHSDGSRFWVVTDSYGSRFGAGDTIEQATDDLLAKVAA